MRRLFQVLAIAALILFPTPSQALTLKTVTFNLMVDLAFDSWLARGIPPWAIRRHLAAELLGEQHADLIGLQEALPYQLSDLSYQLADFDVISDEIHTDSALLIRRDRFQLLQHGTLWLSERPHVPYSVDYGNVVPRNVVWAKLRDQKSKQRFYAMVTHFDARRQAKISMAEQMRDYVSTLMEDELPIIFMGDFNLSPGHEGYSILLNSDLSNIYDLPPLQPGTKPTYLDRSIDHILVAPADQFETLIFQVVEPYRERTWLSDHRLVAAEIRYNSSSESIEKPININRL